jgi:hypothetical protein
LPLTLQRIENESNLEDATRVSSPVKRVFVLRQSCKVINFASGVFRSFSGDLEIKIVQKFTHLLTLQHEKPAKLYVRIDAVTVSVPTHAHEIDFCCRGSSKKAFDEKIY